MKRRFFLLRLKILCALCGYQIPQQTPSLRDTVNIEPAYRQVGVEQGMSNVEVMTRKEFLLVIMLSEGQRPESKYLVFGKGPAARVRGTRLGLTDALQCQGDTVQFHFSPAVRSAGGTEAFA